VPCFEVEFKHEENMKHDYSNPLRQSIVNEIIDLSGDENKPVVTIDFNRIEEVDSGAPSSSLELPDSIVTEHHQWLLPPEQARYQN
jgi:hypothetical protein